MCLECGWQERESVIWKRKQVQEEGVFHDTFHPGCDRHFDLVQVLQFYCGKSKSFFRHQSGDESVDRSSWNFFHHVYSDILSCGCLSWRCRSGKPFGCILYLSFFPKVISGPIVQWKDFQRQTVHRRVDETEFLDGLNRIMIGFAKK